MDVRLSSHVIYYVSKKKSEILPTAQAENKLFQVLYRTPACFVFSSALRLLINPPQQIQSAVPPFPTILHKTEYALKVFLAVTKESSTFS